MRRYARAWIWKQTETIAYEVRTVHSVSSRKKRRNILLGKRPL